jgi:hypothetical protein
MWVRLYRIKTRMNRDIKFYLQFRYSFDHLQHHAVAVCGPPVRVAATRVAGFIATLVCRTAKWGLWRTVCHKCLKWYMWKLLLAFLWNGVYRFYYFSCIFVDILGVSPSRWGEPALLWGCQVTLQNVASVWAEVAGNRPLRSIFPYTLTIPRSLCNLCVS